MHRLAVCCALAVAGAALLRGGEEPPARAGTALELSIADLVDRGDLVLEARVRSRHSRRNHAGHIETVYALDVDRTFWGEDLPTREITLPGGVLEDGSGMIVPGVQMLAPREEVLLFLSGPSADGMRMPVGLAQGRFRIARDRHGARIAVRDQAGLALAHPGARPIEAPAANAYDYAELVAEVHAAANAKRARREEGR